VSRRPTLAEPATSAPAPSGPDGWSAGQLARAVGVSTDTLRHYERKGVLPAPRRLANGYRRYPADALARVRTVRAALALGFTLDELAALLRARERGRPPCREVRELAAAKLAAAERRVAELTRLLDTLRGVVAAWDERLARTPAGAAARLLDALGAIPGVVPADLSTVTPVQPFARLPRRNR
jgi:DNA-binding transcriptional MerR regulator